MEKQIKSLADVYNNIEILSNFHQNEPLLIKLEEPYFSKVLNQVKCSKGLNIYTDNYGSLTTTYTAKKKGMKYSVLIKLELIGNSRMSSAEYYTYRTSKRKPNSKVDGILMKDNG